MTLHPPLLLIVERNSRRVFFCLESRDDCVELPLFDDEDPHVLADQLAEWLRASGATVQIEERE